MATSAASPYAFKRRLLFLKGEGSDSSLRLVVSCRNDDEMKSESHRIRITSFAQIMEMMSEDKTVVVEHDGDKFSLASIRVGDIALFAVGRSSYLVKPPSNATKDTIQFSKAFMSLEKWFFASFVISHLSSGERSEAILTEFDKPAWRWAHTDQLRLPF